MWKIGDFAKLAGVSLSTLRRWESESRLVADRTMGNQRLYTDKHLALVKNLKDTKVVEGNAIIYCRVSSGSQKEDLANGGFTQHYPLFFFQTLWATQV